MLKWGTLYKDNESGQVCKHFPCHAGQLEALQTEAKYILALGGKNGGKTSVAMLWLFNEIGKFNGQGQFLVVGPTADVVLSATLQAWEGTIKGTAYQGKFVGASNNPHYRLGTGGVIYFRSAGADYEGLKPQAVVIDEAGNLSEEQYKVVLGRVTQGGRIFMATTPYLSHDWLNRLIIVPANNGDKEYFFRCFPSTANPTTDAKTIEHYKKTLPPWQYEMEYEGKFTKMPGLVYDFADYNGVTAWVDTPAPLEDTVGFYGAIDFGGTDPHCFLVGQLDTRGKLTIIAEHYGPGDIIGLFQAMQKWHYRFTADTGHKVKAWFCDHQKSAILSLRKMGFNARPALKGAESIPLGISLVQSKLRMGELFAVLPECPNLKAESLLYRYPMVDGEADGNRPVDRDNHAMDALRYLCLGIWGKDVGKQLRLSALDKA